MLPSALRQVAAKIRQSQRDGTEAVIVVGDHHFGAMLAGVGLAGNRACWRARFVDLKPVTWPLDRRCQLICGLWCDRGLAHPETGLPKGRWVSTANARPFSTLPFVGM